MIMRIRGHLRDYYDWYEFLLDGPDDLAEDAPALVTESLCLVTLVTLLVTVKHGVALKVRG